MRSFNTTFFFLKQKLFNETEYDQLYPSSSAPGRMYETPKMQKFSSSD